ARDRRRADRHRSRGGALPGRGHRHPRSRGWQPRSSSGNHDEWETSGIGAFTDDSVQTYYWRGRSTAPSPYNCRGAAWPKRNGARTSRIGARPVVHHGVTMILPVWGVTPAELPITVYS